MCREISNERFETFQEWVQSVENSRTKRYIQERIMSQIDWYRAKCNTCKMRYRRWMILSIILSSIIPVISIFANSSLIFKLSIAALGVSVTGVNSYLSFQNHKNLWNTYRNSREYLSSILYLYFNHAGIFDKEMDPDKRDRKLIETCQTFFQKEVTDCLEIMKPQ